MSVALAGPNTDPLKIFELLQNHSESLSVRQNLSGLLRVPRKHPAGWTTSVKRLTSFLLIIVTASKSPPIFRGTMYRAKPDKSDGREVSRFSPKLLN